MSAGGFSQPLPLPFIPLPPSLPFPFPLFTCWRLLSLSVYDDLQLLPFPLPFPVSAMRMLARRWWLVVSCAPGRHDMLTQWEKRVAQKAKTTNTPLNNTHNRGAKENEPTTPHRQPHSRGLLEMVLWLRASSGWTEGLLCSGPRPSFQLNGGAGLESWGCCEVVPLLPLLVFVLCVLRCRCAMVLEFTTLHVQMMC